MSISSRSPGSKPSDTLVWIAAGSFVQGLCFVAAMLGVLVVFVPIDLFDFSREADVAANMAFRHHDSVRSIRLSADGKQAWVLRRPAVLQQVEVDTGRIVYQQSIASDYISGLQITSSSAGEAAVYVSSRGTMLHSLHSSDPPRLLFRACEICTFVAATPRHELLAVGRGTTVEVWSAATAALCRTIDLGCAPTKLVWAPNGRRLLVALTDGRLQLFDGDTLTLERSQPTAIRGGMHAAWAENGDDIGAFNDIGTSLVWDLRSGRVEEINHVEKAYLNTAVLSPDGQWVAVPGEEDQVWLVSSAADLERRRLGSATSRIYALCFTVDGASLLVGSSDGRVECWNVADGSIRWSLDGGSSMMDQSSLRQPASMNPMQPRISPVDGLAPFVQRGASCASTRS